MLFKKEIYCTYSLEDFNKAKNILINNDISYTYKVINQAAPSIFDNRRSYTGTLGIKIYYLFTVRIDFEKAQYLLKQFC